MCRMKHFEVSSFRPAWWLPGPHLQTLGARWLRSKIEVPFERERLELPDGDFVDLDFAFGRPDGGDDNGRPLVLVLHGLEGSARSGYALVIYRSLREQGIDGVGLNFRSCSGEMNRLARAYHSGETEDLGHVLELLAERYPGHPLSAIGVSLGGNALLKYLGTSDDAHERLKAAVAISVPFDLSAGADSLRRPQGLIYARHLLGKLRRKVEAKQHLLPSEVRVAQALSARSFREFDEAVTAPIHGFDGAEDYYRKSSAGRFLASIRTPTLLLHSYDDPFLPPHCVPRDAAQTNPCLVTAFTERGGHIGFVTGRSPLHPVFWAEHEAVRFVAAGLDGSNGRA